MSRRTSRGFTLVELLMVVLIIGLLVALLLPAIQATRESGRRTQCLARMRELGAAVNAYEQAKNVYPGWNNRVIGQITAANPVRSVAYTEGWVNELLPYLGRNDIYAAMHPGPPIGSPGTTQTPGIDSNGNILLLRVPMNGTLVCPSDVDKTLSGGPDNPISFACNAGREDATGPGPHPADWRTNAVFMDRNDQKGRPVQATDANFIKNGDGLSTTLLLSENLDATSWPNDIVLERTYSALVFWPPDPNTGRFPPKDVHRINGEKINVATPYDTTRPSSNHLGGVNVLFADGHGRFVRQDIEYGLYCALMTPKGGQAMEPGTTTASDPQIRNQPRITLD
jgi:prepilin-type N-terminal cleavage/methylation domain-containing protein/prepilin-type processing-associated H-X9-DG protein